MTVVSSERLVGTGTGLLPRVNLLPPEIAEKRQFRRVQMGLGSVVLASVGVVGLLFVSATHGVSAANDDLAAATTKNAALHKEAATFNTDITIRAQAAAAQAQLATAMGDEVRYSQQLNDLALSIPSNVWIKTLAFTQTPPTAVAGAAATAGPAPVGTFTVTGSGFSHDDVALWLESISGLKSYSNAYFSNSTEVLLGSKLTVNFTTSANLTDKALSGRYKAGG